MMNSEKENEFINLFIVKEKADRLKYELSKKDKRKTGIGQFCHNINDMIKTQYLYQKMNTSSPNELYGIIRKISKSDVAYVISYDDRIDGTEQKLFEAINSCIYYGMPSIIIIEKVVIIITEQEKGSPEKYILYLNT